MRGCVPCPEGSRLADLFIDSVQPSPAVPTKLFVKVTNKGSTASTPTNLKALRWVGMMGAAALLAACGGGGGIPDLGRRTAGKKESRDGNVASKAEILDHVWDYDFGGDARVLETYVSYLRRKLDQHGPPLIHTVRGVGYALREA